MPAMANITVKNAANADVIFTAATPSAGDRSPAVWRANGSSAIIGHRPMFQMVTRENGRQNGRVVEVTYRHPIVDSTTTPGSPKVIATVPFTISGTLPTNVDVALVKDAFIQLGNLLVSTLIRSSIEEGYAPT